MAALASAILSRSTAELLSFSEAGGDGLGSMGAAMAMVDAASGKGKPSSSYRRCRRAVCSQHTSL